MMETSSLGEPGILSMSREEPGETEGHGIFKLWKY